MFLLGMHHFVLVFAVPVALCACFAVPPFVIVFACVVLQNLLFLLVSIVVAAFLNQNYAICVLGVVIPTYVHTRAHTHTKTQMGVYVRGSANGGLF